jgi:hypothetical protein
LLILAINFSPVTMTPVINLSPVTSAPVLMPTRKGMFNGYYYIMVDPEMHSAHTPKKNLILQAFTS